MLLFIEVNVMEQDEDNMIDYMTELARSLKTLARGENIVADVAVTTEAGERFHIV